jgi:hypothetical protein
MYFFVGCIIIIKYSYFIIKDGYKNILYYNKLIFILMCKHHSHLANINITQLLNKDKMNLLSSCNNKYLITIIFLSYNLTL